MTATSPHTPKSLAQMELRCSAVLPRQVFRHTLLLCCAAILAEAASDSNTQKRSSSQSQDEELESVSDLAPSAIHWALAVFLGVTLVGGLLRVARVLQKDDGITPMRHAPEGMRPVQCGACGSMQHVILHGRIFICYSCHAANRIAMDPTGPEEPALVAATGPLRSFEFRREGENFFQETQRLEIEDAEAAQLISKDVNIPANATDTVVAAETAPDLEAGENNGKAIDTDPRLSPRILGHANVDSEVISNCSKPSKQSRMSRMSANGLPTCVVCLEDPGNMVLLPCAHGGVCDGCITRIAQNRASGGAHCPHCRSIIETLVKIHEVSGTNIKGVEFRIPIARAP